MPKKQKQKIISIRRYKLNTSILSESRPTADIPDDDELVFSAGDQLTVVARPANIQNVLTVTQVRFQKNLGTRKQT